jgi:hypothetical protein
VSLEKPERMFAGPWRPDTFDRGCDVAAYGRTGTGSCSERSEGTCRQDWPSENFGPLRGVKCVRRLFAGGVVAGGAGSVALPLPGHPERDRQHGTSGHCTPGGVVSSSGSKGNRQIMQTGFAGCRFPRRAEPGAVAVSGRITDEPGSASTCELLIRSLTNRGSPIP